MELKAKIGDKYGLLTVLDISKGSNRILCKCDCGNIKEFKSCNLYSGNSKSCGCLGSPGNTKHGDKNTRLYHIWKSMRERCNTTSCNSYKRYGGRGIKICPEWDDYLLFKDWALKNGYKENLTIDRINVNGNYEPNNCRWATYKEQANNKTNNHFITFNGKTLTTAQWSEEIGINVNTIHRRIKKGLPIEKVLSPKKNRGN